MASRIHLFSGKIDPDRLYLSKDGWVFGKASELTLKPEPDRFGVLLNLEQCQAMLQEQQKELLGPGLVCIDLVDPDKKILPWKGYIWFDAGAIQDDYIREPAKA